MANVRPQSAIILGLSVLAGYANAQFRSIQLDHINNQKLAKGQYFARIEDQRKSTNGYRLICKELESKLGKRYQGRVIVNVPEGTLSSVIIGSKVRLDVDFSYSISAVANPFEFNYGEYCRDHGIFAQVYIDSLREINSKNVKGILPKWRSQALNWIDDLPMNGEQRALIQALTLGYKGELDSQFRQRFSQTGLAHILAVSGLHVGLVFAIIVFLINLIRFPLRLFSKSWFLISIPILWIYAFLAGFQDSIIRACLMLSVYVFNRYWLKKDVTAVEAVMFVMLALLIEDPQNLNDVGFQLSFAAVIGLICCMNYWSGLIETKSMIVRYVLSMVIMSMIATIFTAPFLIMHFHAFSAWSPLSSLLGIPIAFLLICFSGLAMIPMLGLLVNKMLYWLTGGLITINDSLADLGLLYFENVWWSPMTIVFVILALSMMAVGFLEKNKIAIYAMLVLTLLAILAQSWDIYYMSRRQTCMLYHDFSSVQLDYIKGRKLTSVLFDGEKKKHQLPHRYHVNIKHSETIGIDQNELFRLDSYCLQYLDSSHISISPLADYYLIGPKVSYIPFDALSGKTIVLTTRRSNKLARLLKSKSNELNIKQIWDIKEQGPYDLFCD